MSNAQQGKRKAVGTTIVQGRLPGNGRSNDPVPRGIEVLVKKASVDDEFRKLLLSQRGSAAAAIDLQLDPAENAMLSAIPPKQLSQIVDQTVVPTEQRRVFMGSVAALMLAALGVSLAAGAPNVQAGVRIELPKAISTNLPPTDLPSGSVTNQPVPPTNAPPPVVRGIRPGKASISTFGVRGAMPIVPPSKGDQP